MINVILHLSDGTTRTHTILAKDVHKDCISKFNLPDGVIISSVEVNSTIGA